MRPIEVFGLLRHYLVTYERQIFDERAVALEAVKILPFLFCSKTTLYPL